MYGAHGENGVDLAECWASIVQHGTPATTILVSLGADIAAAREQLTSDATARLNETWVTTVGGMGFCSSKIKSSTTNCSMCVARLLRGCQQTPVVSPVCDRGNITLKEAFCDDPTSCSMLSIALS